MTAQTRCDEIALDIWRRYPREADWLMQDSKGTLWSDGHADGSHIYHHDMRDNRDTDLERNLIATVCSRIVDKSTANSIMNQATKIETGPDDMRWLQLYEKACSVRRSERLNGLLMKTDKIIYAKHNTFGSFIYFNTEFDGDNGPTGLFELDLKPEKNSDNNYATEKNIFDPEEKIVRDPDVHWDGQKMLFAWRKTKDTIGCGSGNLMPAGCPSYET